MDLVDLLIIILLVSAIVRGLKTGLLELLFSSAGFLGGLLLGSEFAKHLAAHQSGPGMKLFIILVTEFGLAIILGAVGDLVGLRLNAYAHRLHLAKLNQWLGAALEVIFTLVIVWLLASAFSNVRSYNIGSEINGSLIIRKLDAALPQPPDVFAELEKVISPNGFPSVFLGIEPHHTTVSATSTVNNKVVLADEPSVVQVEGLGCGGIVYGSGFVVANDIVVTDAHVVAGIAKPEVVDRIKTHATTVIWFDPNMDIAVLRVNGLDEPALSLSGDTLPDNNGAAILGYPGGGPLVADNAVIIDHVTAEGRNIYNQGVVLRNIYEVQTDVEPGDSGGPLIAPDGSVAGVVFAKSLSQNNVGYALLIDQVKPLIQKAEQQNTTVSTGSCAQT